MAAPLVVRSPNDPLTALDVPELLLVFSALQLDGNAQVAEHTMMEQMNGREGNVALVNGQYQPVCSVEPGRLQRLRLINASNALYLRLSLGGVAMVQVGTDGGLLEKPLPAQSELLLAPAERMEVCVVFENDATLQALTYDKGWMGDGMGGAGDQKPALQSLDLMQFKVSGARVNTVKIPAKLTTIQPLGAATKTRKMVLSENMQMSMAGGKHSMTMEFMINERMFDMNRVDFTAKTEAVELWEIVNQTDMDHPFHVHGSHFQVVSIEENGVVTPFPYLAWKDTINTRKGQTVRIKIQQKHTGLRMYHCHILEHEDLGMMGQYQVI